MEPVTPRQSRERLLAIINHLRKPQSELSLDRFNFARVAKEGSCGTNGCAMGEYPAIWPDVFEYGRKAFSSTIFGVIHTPTSESVHRVNAAWLGISAHVDDVLFMPIDSDGDGYIGDDLYDAGVRRLRDTASKAAVADNIQAYVDGFLAPDMLDDED